MSLFDDIASGATRMRQGEDALIWGMRASGAGWGAIEDAIQARRARQDQHCESMLLKRYAAKWRDDLRAERAGA